MLILSLAFAFYVQRFLYTMPKILHSRIERDLLCQRSIDSNPKSVAKPFDDYSGQPSSKMTHYRRSQVSACDCDEWQRRFIENRLHQMKVWIDDVLEVLNDPAVFDDDDFTRFFFRPGQNVRPHETCESIHDVIVRRFTCLWNEAHHELFGVVIFSCACSRSRRCQEDPNVLMNVTPQSNKVVLVSFSFHLLQKRNALVHH